MIRRLSSLLRRPPPQHAHDIFIDRGPAYMKVWREGPNVCLAFGASPRRRILFSTKAARQLSDALSGMGGN